MIIKRTLSTFGLWLIAILLPFLLGPQGAVWLIALLSVFTQLELYSLIIKIGFRPQCRLGCFLGLLIILGSWYAPRFSFFNFPDVGVDIFTLAVIIVSFSLLRRPNFTEAKSNIMPTLLGLLLVPFMFHFYVRIAHHYADIGFPSTGLFLILWLVAVAKFTDVGGLLVGLCVGRHKLAPVISPGKTWEGALGGIVIAVAVGALLSVFFQKITYFPRPFTPFVATVIAIPVAMIAIASDLIESVLKRQAGVKDSGGIIPGIGGIFDLTDSLLLSAPLGFLIFKYFLF